jgi:hypothetical protein
MDTTTKADTPDSARSPSPGVTMAESTDTDCDRALSDGVPLYTAAAIHRETCATLTPREGMARCLPNRCDWRDCAAYAGTTAGGIVTPDGECAS